MVTRRNVALRHGVATCGNGCTRICKQEVAGSIPAGSIPRTTASATIPSVALLYNLPLGRTLPILFAIAVLAAVGLVAVGTLFSAMAANTRLAELLLPMLSLPFFVPVVYGAAQATATLLAGRPLAEAAPFFKLLIAFDLVFLTACTLAFPYTLEE